MDTFLYDFTHNRVLVCAFWGFVTAQVIKTLLYVIVNRSFNPERLLGDGGMPSSHSSTVMATTTGALLTYGAGSGYFALAVVLAMIVMHDAMGVRRETGIQAKVINDMMEFFQRLGEPMPVDEKLKELVGHTPLQVMAGAMLGIIVGIITCELLV